MTSTEISVRQTRLPADPLRLDHLIWAGAIHRCTVPCWST